MDENKLRELERQFYKEFTSVYHRAPEYKDAIEWATKKTIARACELLRNEIPNYLGVFTSHFKNDDDVEQVVVKPCVNSQIYDDFKKTLEE